MMILWALSSLYGFGYNVDDWITPNVTSFTKWRGGLKIDNSKNIGYGYYSGFGYCYALLRLGMLNPGTF